MKRLFLFLLLVLFSCARQEWSSWGPNTSSSLLLDSECEKGITAFSQTLHPLLRRDCLPCHDTGGISGKPHSVADPEKSYTRMVGYVDWSQIDSSYLVKKGGNRHCLKYEGGKCQTTEEDLRQVLKQWWEMGQKECPNFGAYVTQPEVISKPSQTLHFDLSRYVAGLGPIALTVQVETLEGRHLLSRPRLKGHTAAVSIEGLKILKNGKLQNEENHWELVKASVLPGESPLLSADILELAKESEADEISVGLKNLKKRDSFHCQHLETFRKDVLALLPRGACYRCHGGGSTEEAGEPIAKMALNLDGTDEELCQRLLLRGSTRYATSSPLIALPLHGALGHPRALPFASEVLPAWTKWVSLEGVH